MASAAHPAFNRPNTNGIESWETFICTGCWALALVTTRLRTVTVETME
jgi:hypothetical protein